MPKETLAQIDAHKRDRVLGEAARLFAERGFARADMAELASRAGVAKGSLYNYFDSKQDCYLTVCRDGLARYRAAIYNEVDPDWPALRQIDHIFRAGLRFVNAHPELIVLYLNISAAGMDRFAEQLSSDAEQRFAELLKRSLERDRTRGLLRPGLDVPFAAHAINGLYINCLSASVSRHHQLRLREYLDLDPGRDRLDHERLLERSIAFIQSIITQDSPAARARPRKPAARRGNPRRKGDRP